jgi:hypothetical protein
LPSGDSKHNKDLFLRLFLIAFYSHYLGFVGNVWACPIKPFKMASECDLWQLKSTSGFDQFSTLDLLVFMHPTIAKILQTRSK